MIIDADYTALEIAGAYPEDTGAYSVIAKNLGGEARNTCRLTVEGSRQPGREVQTKAPQFVEQLKNKEVVEGSRTRIDCVCVGLPDPEVC